MVAKASPRFSSFTAAQRTRIGGTLSRPHFARIFHALALDQRGHGDSEWPEQWEYGTRHYVSDFDQVIDEWGLGAPVLVGHSMGAHNVLVYAAEYSDKLRAMVVIDSPADYSEYAVEFLRSYAEKPPRRFDSLEEATRNFKVLPRETLAKKEILDHVAHHTYKTPRRRRMDA